MTYTTPDEAWEAFWAPLVTRSDGSIDEEQIKKELFDYSVLLHNVPLVYDAVTNGRVSKPLTDPKVVISLHEEVVMEYERQAVEDYKKENDA